jgi:hypothetical protein
MSLAGAVILAAIAGALHWKHRVPRFVAWVLLLVGVGVASTLTDWVGGFGGFTVYGVGLFTLIAIVTGIFFWEEAVKQNGLHRVRTPLIAVLFGVSLMSAGGAFFEVVQNALEATASNVNQAVVSNLNGK